MKAKWILVCGIERARKGLKNQIIIAIKATHRFVKTKDGKLELERKIWKNSPKNGMKNMLIFQAVGVTK